MPPVEDRGVATENMRRFSENLLKFGHVVRMYASGQTARQTERQTHRCTSHFYQRKSI